MSVDLKSRVEPYHFKFDCVLPEATTQEEVFERKQQACSWGIASSAMRAVREAVRASEQLSHWWAGNWWFLSRGWRLRTGRFSE